MDDFAKRSRAEQREIFEQAAAEKGTTPVVIEKDFWVSWILGKLFGDRELGSILTFKGGTSLSKVYGMIERFSEDIDLVLDWSALSEEDPWEPRSRTRQDCWNRQILDRAAILTKEHLLPRVQSIVAGVCEAFLDDQDPHSILLRYPASFEDDYIRPVIKLEIGPLASKEPHEERAIRSYAAELFPALFSRPECAVRVIRAERTFWEKATILHQEAHRPAPKPQPPGYSRHYYDLYMMADRPEGVRALADRELLQDVVGFKQKYYPRAWARYDLACQGSLRLVPGEDLQDVLGADYRAMRQMIFGPMPEFGVILERLRGLEVQVNRD